MISSDPARDQQKVSMAIEVLNSCGRVRLATRGYSMLPSLWPGDVLTIRAAQLDELSEGKLVLFRREGRFVTHRVLRKAQVNGQTCLITRGDSMLREDHPVIPSEVLGEVISTKRDGRELKQVPACTPIVRGVGLALSGWGRLRGVVVRLRQRGRDRSFGVPSDHAVSL